jgi:hypothetical protein
MDEQQKFEFDLQGYITVPDALTPEAVAALTALLDAHAAQELSAETRHANFGLDLGDAPTQPRPEGGRAGFLERDRDTARLLSWGKPYLDLIDNPSVSPLLEELLGSDFRLDHVYGTLLRAGRGPDDPTLCGTSRWHSGPQHWPRQRHEYFSADAQVFSSGLTVVAYELCDVPEGSGGMGALPGTHKSQFPLHGLEGTISTAGDMPAYGRAVAVSAGSAIIFTEAMTHATLPWYGLGPRKTIFYKYCPMNLAWNQHIFPMDEHGELPYEGLTERARGMLMPAGGMRHFHLRRETLARREEAARL